MKNLIAKKNLIQQKVKYMKRKIYVHSIEIEEGDGTQNKTNTSSMYLYDVIIIVAFATNSNGKKYRKIQNHISGSGNS